MHVDELAGLEDRLLSFFLERCPVGVALTDSDGKILSANPGLLSLAAGTESRIVGRSIEDLIAPSFAEAFRLAMDEARLGASGEVRVSLASFDGILRSCQLRLIPGDGRVLAVLEPDAAASPDVDTMTGAVTPETFSAQLSLELYRAGRYRRPLAVLKCEIDGLDSVSTDYGDDVRDRLVAQVGWTLRKQTRRTDLVARVSEGQFAVLLPETDLIGAFVTAEKLSTSVKETSVETPMGNLHPTASFGVVAASDAGESTCQTLTEAADWVLSLARRSGPGGIEAAPSIAYRMAG